MLLVSATEAIIIVVVVMSGIIARIIRFNYHFNVPPLLGVQPRFRIIGLVLLLLFVATAAYFVEKPAMIVEQHSSSYRLHLALTIAELKDKLARKMKGRRR